MALRKFLFMNATEGFSEEQAAVDELQLGKLSLSGLAGIALDGGSQRAVNFADPTTNQDLATKFYVDSVATGLDWKASARVATTANIVLSGAQTIDGIAAIAGDRVLVKNQSTGSENGVYVVAAGAWSRATDFDDNAEVTAGAAIWIEEGTLAGDTGWVLTTDNPIVVGTTALTFTQFTGVGQIVAGAGLTKALPNTLDVGRGDGIAVDADLIRIDLATNPALEFVGASPNGQIQFKPDTTRGLDKDASGAFIDLAVDPGLQFTGGNLDNKHKSTGGISKDSGGNFILIDPVPNNVSTSAAGLKVTRAPVVEELYTADGAIAVGDVVYFSANDKVKTAANSADATARVVGVAVTAAADLATVKIVHLGKALAVLSGATFNTPFYVGPTGLLIQFASLAAGARVLRIGMAMNATDLYVDIKDYGKKAV